MGMGCMSEREPVLLFGYGNPDRGDDALGPVLVERMGAALTRAGLAGVACVEDFALNIEHALDLEGRDLVVFVDAAATGPAPFCWSRVRPEQEAWYSTHALTPGGVLCVFGQVSESPPPASYLLAIRGYRFDLGAPLTGAASANLAAAMWYLRRLLDAHGAAPLRPDV